MTAAAKVSMCAGDQIEAGLALKDDELPPPPLQKLCLRNVVVVNIINS